MDNPYDVEPWFKQLLIDLGIDPDTNDELGFTEQQMNRIRHALANRVGRRPRQKPAPAPDQDQPILKTE